MTATSQTFTNYLYESNRSSDDYQLLMSRDRPCDTSLGKREMSAGTKRGYSGTSVGISAVKFVKQHELLTGGRRRETKTSTYWRGVDDVEGSSPRTCGEPQLLCVCTELRREASSRG